MDARLQYFTTSDGLKLYYELWVPERVEAIVIFLHGLGDHVGRYSELAKTLTKCNFGICMFDMRGNGRSSGRRGHAKSFGTLLKDLSQIIEMVQNNHPNMPIFLAGHSFGGQLAINFVARYSKGLRGLIALSPSIEPVVPIPVWKKKLAKFLSKFLPIVKFHSNINPADFSHDENVVNNARKDPLMNWHVTARLGTEILKNLEQLPTMVFQVKVPCLFMHGGGDKICSIDATRKFYHSVLVQNKDFKTYSGFAHELLNETGREKVLRDIVSWISSQLIAFKRIARDSDRRVAPNKEGQNYDQETVDLWHSPDNSLHH